MKYSIYFFFVLFFFVSCEEEPVPMLEIEVPPGDKAVLVEDFTGISCLNCPEGARIVERLRTTDDLKKRIIPLAIHTLGFDNLHPDSKYQFKTDKGQEMQDHLGDLFSKPAAAINRTFSQESSSLFYEQKEKWPDFILDELARPTEINMNLSLDYNSSSRALDIEVTYIPVDDISVPLKITALIAESGLVDPQTDLNGVVEDFVHNHVLRDIISAATGNALGSSFMKGQIYKESFSYTIPPEEGWWVAENCEIVVFINESTPDSKRVIQAVSKDVVE